MRLTVLGSTGGYPEAGGACSGYLVEHDGFRLVLDLGYATVPRLLGHVSAGEVDAVYLTHGHPDHCVDVNPLLRARGLTDAPVTPLPLYSPPGALDRVLALDKPGMLDRAYVWHQFTPGDGYEIGPFRVGTRALPHSVPNAGVRLAAGGAVLAYTGDGGPSDDLVDLARGADLLIAEATYVDEVTGTDPRYLSSARQAGAAAARAGVRRLLLTHLWPGTDPGAARDAAAAHFRGDIAVAVPGMAGVVSGG